MLYEMPVSGPTPGVWDKFRIRNLGLAVQRRAARQFDGEIQQLRVRSTERVARRLELNPRKLTHLERLAFENWALVLDLIPELANWDTVGRKAVARIIQAKPRSDDATYARLLQNHVRLRKAVIAIGSFPTEPEQAEALTLNQSRSKLKLELRTLKS